ncbi:hypothetical protein, variant [Exophiala sideris]|uniref:RRM domain-containing protein n=1 Tax=Exophiala sideris TaxID=1016849 RepID=A0A0D1YEG3_9EURO|nr:hypothetical protein PV11_06757 [Exophiala sideris]KIV79185.1 hypothetical protein, variant [Exophiala sideris]
MAAEEDNFDIDIYGDGEGEGDMGNDGNMDYKEEEEEEDAEFILDAGDIDTEGHTAETQPQVEPQAEQTDTQALTQREAETGDVKTEQPQSTPTQLSSAPQQGTKRKETSDDRPIDHGATNALMISDLHWWITEDDVRGWANEAGAEDELREITFSEHKVNGKSKGQTYLEFSSAQAATAAKRRLESLGDGQPASRKHSVAFANPSQNPFKTLPKDAPARAREERPVRGGSFTSGPRGDYNHGPGNQGFRGRGGFNRGGYTQHGGYNRNFSGPTGGYNNQNMGLQGNMGMGNNYGGFNRGGMMGNPMRGNMGGMRGSRGGMNNMMAMGGGMGMGNMGMNMNPMMAGMGMTGFQGNQFNPGMFNNAGQRQGFNNGGDWNQHGAKRQRQE